MSDARSSAQPTPAGSSYAGSSWGSAHAGPPSGSPPAGPSPAGPPRAAASAVGRRRSRARPYLLALPGVLWLLLFFLLPVGQLVATSLYDPAGSLEAGYAMTWAVGTYPEVLVEYRWHLARAFGYAALATLCCLLLGYPLAYAIARRAGRWRHLLLVCVVAPFFTSFLVRTLAWKTILSDQGPVVGALRAVHLLAADGRLLASGTAVVAGLTYNFLPFMVLPLYASLERLDGRLLDAAADLYAGPVQRFRTVVLPLSLPGVAAGTLLTFIPAAGDYVNAELLGTPRTHPVGNVIESAFLVSLDYPRAAALSVLLMTATLALVVGYLRRLGRDALVGR
ncbi:MAG TPA: ABC transporter permease [Pilimelia sp.]|nr:ABC transporter permease [Pilimelia sp.]